MSFEPERWRVDAGEAALARLDIPPHASRERVFEVSCSMTVRVPAAAHEPWHELQLLADGAMQWQRRIVSAEGSDGLEVRLRRTVAVGQGLRLLAKVRCQGAQRQTLRLEAEEA